MSFLKNIEQKVGEKNNEYYWNGTVWAIICIVVDLVGWVLIKHPWRLTFKEFYVDYQPWITLIYLAIFAGPVVGFLLMR